MYQESIEKGELPLTTRTGLVALLHKKGSKDELANRRPITLMTTYYKVQGDNRTAQEGNWGSGATKSDLWGARQIMCHEPSFSQGPHKPGGTAAFSPGDPEPRPGEGFRQGDTLS